MSKEEIHTLNQRIAQLALLSTLRTSEKETLERKYNDRLAVLNEYIEKLHKLLNVNTEEGAVEDVDFIERLKMTEDGYLLVPTKRVVEHKLIPPTSATTKATAFKEGKNAKSENSTALQEMEPASSGIFIGGSNATGRKKKMTCSNCNERGHKRAQCPKILFPTSH